MTKKTLSGGLAVAAILALTACEPAPMDPEVAGRVQLLPTEFQKVCGVLARSGDLGATRQAALAAGYKSEGVLNGSSGFYFKNFEILTRDSVQVQLTDQQTGIGPFAVTNGKFCGVVVDGSGGSVSDGLFRASSEALARASGTTTSAKPAIASGAGQLQFNAARHTVRLDYQSNPAGLVLYTFMPAGQN